MAGDPIDRAYLEIDGDQVFCDSISTDPEDDSDFVTAMTKDNQPIGVSHGNLRHRLTAEMSVREDEDVNFHRLLEDKSNVPVSIEYENGETWDWSNGVISKVGMAARHGEKVTRSVDILAWGLQIS